MKNLLNMKILHLFIYKIFNMNIQIPDNFVIQELLKGYKQQFFIEDEKWINEKIYYYSPQITFREVPDEISLTFPTLCYEPCSEDCNSKFCWIKNWKDDKKELSFDIIKKYIDKNYGCFSSIGISCITIMTSLNFIYLNDIFKNIKNEYPKLKAAIYVGKDWEELLRYKDFYKFDFKNIDYIKIGSYINKFGGLDSLVTNQKFYSISHFEDGDIFCCINEKFR